MRAAGARPPGDQQVGYYLTAAAALTGLGLLLIRETKSTDLVDSAPAL